MTNGRWRMIFAFIIMGTIPCYILGLGLWLFSPNPNAPTATPTATLFVTFTPLNSGGATWTPLGNVNQPNNGGANAVFTQIATMLPVIMPSNIPPTSQVFPTSIPVTPSQVPTFFITATPTTRPSPSATFVPTNTSSAPTATIQILLPPTDTPMP